MRSTFRKLTIALVVTTTLASAPPAARAGAAPHFDGVGEAAAGMVALTAVGIAAAVGLVTWLVVANWPEDDLAAPDSVAADGVGAEGEVSDEATVPDVPEEMAIAMIDPVPPEMLAELLEKGARTAPRARPRRR
jgi:hypothetical protein